MSLAPSAVNVRSRVLGVLRWLFTPLALAFLVMAAYAARDTLDALLDAADAGRLAAVVLAWACLHLLAPALAATVLRGLGSRVGYADALRMHVLRLPARYLPGGIWHTVARASDLQAMGVGSAQISALVAIENLIPLAAAITLGSAFAVAAAGASAPLLGLAAAGTALVAALPLAVSRLLPKANLPVATYAKAAAFSVAFWLLAASTFALYWNAFPAVPGVGSLAGLMGAYLLSWAAGFIAVFAPQGIGVFEAVAASMLKGSLPLAGVAVLVAGFRATTLAGDALAYAAGIAYATCARRRHAPK